MYHRINVVTADTPRESRGLTVHPEDFARQMRWLRDHGYSSITQRELWDALMCGRRLPRRPILITFDDGYRDVFFRASPVLLRLGFLATAYVVTGRISARDPSFLTWPLLHARSSGAASRSVSHTVAHHDLTSLPDAALLDDPAELPPTLERRLGHRVPWLAYPFGANDARAAAGPARRLPPRRDDAAGPAAATEPLAPPLASACSTRPASRAWRGCSSRGRRRGARGRGARGAVDPLASAHVIAKHDVLVVGAGCAGMRAAIEAHDAGADVAVISKLHPTRSHSGAAEGGINAALGNAGDDDPETHAFDTVKGSDYLGDQDAIEIFTREAPGDIYQLEHWGAYFSRARMVGSRSARSAPPARRAPCTRRTSPATSSSRCSTSSS